MENTFLLCYFTLLIPGILRRVPMTGSLLKKLMAYGKKPEKRRKNPYISTTIPIRGHPNKTMKIPPKKAALPLILCLWKKNRNVRSNPIKNAKPQRKSICK